MVLYPIEDFQLPGLQMNQQDVEEYWERIEPGFCLLLLNISLFTKLWSFLIKWSLDYHNLEAVFFFYFSNSKFFTFFLLLKWFRLLNGASGIISSPMTSNWTYDHNLLCQWILSPRQQHGTLKMVISPLYMESARQGRCYYDILAIIRGDFESGSLLGNFLNLV